MDSRAIKVATNREATTRATEEAIGVTTEVAAGTKEVVTWVACLSQIKATKGHRCLSPSNNILPKDSLLNRCNLILR